MRASDALSEDRTRARLRAHAARDSKSDALRRQLADQAFSRAAGAPLVMGNRVDLLRDAAQNYPAWHAAIEAATRWVHFEMYIFKNDEAGSALAELLMRKARAGVTVRVLYDWLGAVGKTPGGFWRQMRAAGVDVRCFNRPRLASPVAWIRRDHRKLLAVDGEVAFVAGLCVGQEWLGWPERGIDPWRDTGVAIRGPAVADIEHSFGESWALEGEALPADELPTHAQVPQRGEQALRVIATSPETTGILRLDLLWSAVARERLWLADAYFVGTPAYLGALASTAESGVDVRLLVPSASDIALIAAFSRTQYRPLLEAGVRVFEWNGPMMHAKTAVVDGHWSRVGSTNLNLASWIGNWELDVCVDDERFGEQMEAAYLRDLEDSTEMVLEPGRPAAPRPANASSSRAAPAARPPPPSRSEPPSERR